MTGNTRAHWAPKRAIVLGAGVAGLTAAFALRDRGLDVEIWESRGWLGGRAFSLPAKAGIDRRIDNGPHVMLGCYDHMRRLLRRLGTEDAFEQPRSLKLAYRDASGGDAKLSLPPWVPPSIALPAAILGMKGVPMRVRLRAMRGMAASALGARKGKTFAEWITQHGQDGAPRSWFWDPLCRAIMNAEAELVSAREFLVTLKIAFSGRASRAAIWIPKKPWSEILSEPARAQCARESIVVRDRCRVTGIEVEDGRVAALQAEGRNDASRVPVDDDVFVVSALPWPAYTKLMAAAGASKEASTLASSPIVSVYFDLPVDESWCHIPNDPVQALIDGDPFHFVCRTPDGAPGELALLSGGSRALDGRPVQEIERIAREQLERHYPGCGLAGPKADWLGTARVVREDRATFVARGDFRPDPAVGAAGLQNFAICGDWTETGLPATLEGAARSADAMVRSLAATAGRMRP